MAQSSQDLDSNPTSTPASDPDPYSVSNTRLIYSSASSTSLPPHIDPSSLPQAAPFLGPLTGFTSARGIRIINTRLSSVSSTIYRPLSLQEQQAIAWHTSKGYATSSWGPTFGIVGGMGRWLYTMQDMRWLFLGKLNDESVNQSWREYYKAQAEAAEKGIAEGAVKKPPASVRWDGGRFLFGETELMKSLSLSRKELVIHALRIWPYIGFGWCMAAITMSAFGALTTAFGEIRDPRLSILEKELQAQVLKKMKKEQGGVPGVDRGGDKRRRDPMGRGTGISSEVSKQHRENIERVDGATAGDFDQASPIGGDDFFEEAQAKEQARIMGGSDMKSQRQKSFQRNPQDPFQTTDRQSSFQQDKYERQTRSSEDSYDDASPTGGDGAIGNDDSGAGGSVWARIRQDSISDSEPPSAEGKRMQKGGGSRQPQQNSQPSKREEDSFAFSTSEEEKRYAMDEAQKDFDARVERERDGGDFSGDRGKRW